MLLFGLAITGALCAVISVAQHKGTNDEATGNVSKTAS
jgi:hypothetical protein